MDHAALFGLLYHAGLVAAADVDDARQQATRLSVYLDRYRLVGLEPSLLALSQPNAAVSAYLKPGLENHTHIARRHQNLRQAVYTNSSLRKLNVS